MGWLNGAVEPVTLENSVMISEQLKKCICQIEINQEKEINKKKVSGFFCFIQYNGKYLPVLIFAEYIISFELNEIYIKLNNENKVIKLNDGRKIFRNRELSVAIVEIIPQKDHIYDFLELDPNIFQQNSEKIFEKISVYILQIPIENKIVSFGIIKSINENTIKHFCNTMKGSGGAPILNVSTGKIIGLHTSASPHYNINNGTFLKSSITQFIEMNKDYISSNGLTSANYWYSDSIYTVKSEIQITNYIEKSQEDEKDKIKKLEEKIKELNDLLNDNINTIDELKAKLSRFPFELKEGEKIMSIIITSPDKKNIKSIICKNTDIFHDMEKKLYQNDDKVFGKGKQITINEKNIEKTESLENNKINDNDIIVINNLNV